jgi:hypothetical protein
MVIWSVKDVNRRLEASWQLGAIGLSPLKIHRKPRHKRT